MLDVFLSYSSLDAEDASRLRKALLEAGLTVWQDTEYIRELTDIPTALTDALASTRLTVILASERQAASRVCQWEMLKSLALGDAAGVDRTATVLLDGSVGSLLGSLKRRRAIQVDQTDAGWQRAARELARIVATGTVGREPGRAEQRPPLVGLPGASGDRFIFRLKLLMQLHDHLLDPMRALDRGLVDQPSTVVLHGMGGSGKSSVALFFVEQFGMAFSKGAVWLSLAGDMVGHVVNGDEEREAVFRSASEGLTAWFRKVDLRRFADLAPLLPPPGRDRWEVLRDQLPTWLGEDGTLLLVLDDVPDGVELTDLLPQHPHVSTIVTTRDEGAKGRGYPVLKVGQFTKFEACLLLTRAVDPDESLRRRGVDPWHGDRDSAEHLAGLLGYYPLAIDLVANALLGGEKILHILDEVRQRSLDFYDIAAEVLRLPGGHSVSIMATIASSLRAAKTSAFWDDQARLLRALMVVPAGSRVAVDLLEAALGFNPRTAIRGLARRSIVTYDGTNQAVTCHAVTRDVCRFLWEREEEPFTGLGSAEPKLSESVASQLVLSLTGVGQVDLVLGASNAATALAVLSELEDDARDQTRVERSECYSALAREISRTRARRDSDFDRAVAYIADAKNAVDPPTTDWLAMQWWSAEALKWILVREHAPAIADALASRQLKADARQGIRAADEARLVLGERLLAAGVERPTLDWIQDKLQRSKYNLTGNLIGDAQDLAAESGSEIEIAECLDRAEKLHDELIVARRAATPVPYDQVASSERGKAIIFFLRGLLLTGSPADARTAWFDEAVTWSQCSIRTRFSASVHADEQDVCKSLEVLSKAFWGRLCLTSGATEARTTVDALVASMAVEVQQLDPREPYVPGPGRQGRAGQKQTFHDAQTQAVLAVRDGERDALTVLRAALAWLAIALTTPTPTGKPMSSKDLQDVISDFWGTSERPGEVRFLSLRL